MYLRALTPNLRDLYLGSQCLPVKLLQVDRKDLIYLFCRYAERELHFIAFCPFTEWKYAMLISMVEIKICEECVIKSKNPFS